MGLNRSFLQNFECSFLKCTSRFEDPAEFIEHMKRRHNLSEFKCVLCNESFTRPSTYKRHLLNEIARRRQAIDEEVIMLLDNLPFRNESENIENGPEAIQMTTETLSIPRYFEKEEDSEHFSLRVFEMILNLYGDMGVTKKMAVDITSQLQDVICKPLINNLLSKMVCEEDKKCLENYLQNIDVYFDEMNTEYKFKALLKNNNLYFEPREFLIPGPTDDSKGYLFPLKDNIRILFNTKPDLLLDMLLKYDELVNHNDLENITSVVDAEIWKDKIKDFSGKKVLPILIYQDDVEINNPLGSKSGKQKISTVYITFPLLDDLCISKLGYQIPANLTLSSDFSQGLYPNYYELCLALKDIEENGIQFEMYNDTLTVHFIVATTVGDNLGQNMILGYGMNFALDFFCRFCIITKTDSETEVQENPDILRSNLDNTLSKLGVIRESSFEKEINTFKILDCVSVDVVHDFLEGFLKIEMTGIIKHFLKMNYIDLDFLNNAIAHFDQYSRFEKKNMCTKIKKGRLDSYTLKMSASEVCLFVNYFAMIVAEHIPHDDEYWIFFKVLYKLLNKVMQSKFNNNDLIELQALIKDHNENCMSLVLSNPPHPDRLLPKHHILTHYITSIKKLGPPKYLWVMRLEGFHKCLKHYANATSSRKNIIKSISDKLQLRNALLFFTNTHGLKIRKSKIYNHICLQNYNLIINTVNLPLTDEIPTYFFISIENIRFELHDIVFSQNNDSELFCLYNINRIKHILFVNNVAYFLASKLEIVCYNEEILMLEIALPEEPEYCLLNIDEIVRLPTNIKKYKEKLYVNISNF